MPETHYQLPTAILAANRRPGLARALVGMLDAIDARDVVGRLRACPELDGATIVDEIQSLADTAVERHAVALRRLSPRAR